HLGGRCEVGIKLSGVEVRPAGRIRRQRRQEEEVRVAAVVRPIHDERRRTRTRRRLQGLLVTTRGEQQNSEAREGDGLHGREPRITATEGTSARETRCSAAGETSRMGEYGSRGGPSLDRCPRSSIGSRRHECAGETLIRIRVKVKRIEWRGRAAQHKEVLAAIKHFAPHSPSPAIGPLRVKPVLVSVSWNVSGSPPEPKLPVKVTAPV